MNQVRSSIDIVLYGKPLEATRRSVAVVPITRHESTIVHQGLYSYIEHKHRAVKKAAGEQRALEAVYDCVYEVDGFRTKNRNLGSALCNERAIEHSQAFAAAALAYLLRGSRSHRTQTWLLGKADDDQLKRYFHGIMKAEDEVFAEMVVRGRHQVASNQIFWREQLEYVRQLPIIEDLREAINTSDHLVEV